MAYDSALASAILRAFVGQVFGWLHRVTHASGRPGAVTVIERFGGALNLNPHFHTLVADGVYVERPDGEVAFYGAPAAEAGAVAGVLANVVASVERILAKRRTPTSSSARATRSTCGAPSTASTIRSRSIPTSSTRGSP